MKTASHAAVLPQVLFAVSSRMVEPSELRQHRVSKVARPNKRCDSTRFQPQVLDYVWQSLWRKGTGTFKLLSELGQLAKAA